MQGTLLAEHSYILNIKQNYYFIFSHTNYITKKIKKHKKH